MHLLLALARRLLLPAVVGTAAALAYHSAKGESADVSGTLESLGYFALCVVGTWAPLPLVQHLARKAPLMWQSPVRLVGGVAAVACVWAGLIVLFGALHVI